MSASQQSMQGPGIVDVTGAEGVWLITQSDRTGPQSMTLYRCTLHLGLCRRSGLYRRDS